MLITGVKYHRSKARMSRRELAELAGVTTSILQKMDLCHEVTNITLTFYMRVAEALRVPVEELLKLHDDSELEDGDRTAYPSRTENLQNPVAIYRKHYGLTLAQLGDRLGDKSKEWARQVCADETPQQSPIQALAAYEGITPAEFLLLYAPGNAA